MAYDLSVAGEFSQKSNWCFRKGSNSTPRILFRGLILITSDFADFPQPDLEVQPRCYRVDRPRLEGHVLQLDGDHRRRSGRQQGCQNVCFDLPK
jgi:hypothetical protein